MAWKNRPGSSPKPSASATVSAPASTTASTQLFVTSFSRLPAPASRVHEPDAGAVRELGAAPRGGLADRAHLDPDGVVRAVRVVGAVAEHRDGLGLDGMRLGCGHRFASPLIAFRSSAVDSRPTTPRRPAKPLPVRYRLEAGDDPKAAERGLAALVLTLVALLRQLMERQAIRRVEDGTVPTSRPRLGYNLTRLDERMSELIEQFGLTRGDPGHRLGPARPAAGRSAGLGALSRAAASPAMPDMTFRAGDQGVHDSSVPESYESTPARTPTGACSFRPSPGAGGLEIITFTLSPTDTSRRRGGRAWTIFLSVTWG